MTQYFCAISHLLVDQDNYTCWVMLMLLVWSLLQPRFEKELESSLDQRMVKIKTTHPHTHTQKPYDRLMAQRGQWQQKFFAAGWNNNSWNISRLWPLESLTEILICKKQSLPVSDCPSCYAIWPEEMLLKTWNFIFGHVTAWQTDNNWMNIAQYYTQTIQAFKIAQVKSNFIWLTQHIVQTFNIKTGWSIIFCKINYCTLLLTT
jgi:hypothetical protein